MCAVLQVMQKGNEYSSLHGVSPLPSSQKGQCLLVVFDLARSIDTIAPGDDRELFRDLWVTDSTCIEDIQGRELPYPVIPEDLQWEGKNAHLHIMSLDNINAYDSYDAYLSLQVLVHRWSRYTSYMLLCLETTLSG